MTQPHVAEREVWNVRTLGDGEGQHALKTWTNPDWVGGLLMVLGAEATINPFTIDNCYVPRHAKEV